jgi:hypothetical protein
VARRPWRRAMRLPHLDHRHQRAAPLVALLVAALLPFSAVTPAWAAAGQHVKASAASARMLPAATVNNKVTLPDTSIDGPALDSTGNESVLAWTGTDAAHHLNVETSTDGLHYGNKLILNETSPFRPAVTVTPAQAGNVVALAWTGSDPNHSLNVLFDVYGSSPKKLTLRDESSLSSPALIFGPCFCLAWTGTNANHSLNILPLTVSATAIVPGTKTILTQDSSDAGPNLRRGSATVLDLLWSTRGTQQLRVAAATHEDALQPGTTVGGETSAAAPDGFFLGPIMGLGSQQWIGWTGTDPAHHLNLFPIAGSPAPTKTVLSDTAIGGPALSFNTALDENLLAWTGTDAAHHLNVEGFF